MHCHPPSAVGVLFDVFVVAGVIVVVDVVFVVVTHIFVWLLSGLLLFVVVKAVIKIQACVPYLYYLRIIYT